MSKMVIVDDTSPLIQYNGEWSLDGTNDQDGNGNFGPVYNTTQHWTSGNNSFTFPFEGSFVAVLGSNNPKSSWDCLIDGIPIQLSTFPFWQNNWWICQSSVNDGAHTLTVNAKVADGQMFWFDRILYAPSASVSMTGQALFIDNPDPQIQYGTGWRVDGTAANITNVAGTKFTYEFDGTSIRWFGYVGGGTPTGSGQYSIDGGTPTTFTIATQTAGAPSLFNQKYFGSPDLSSGHHVLDVEYLGGPPNAAQLILDYLEVGGATVSGSVGITSAGSTPMGGGTLQMTAALSSTTAQRSQTDQSGISHPTDITGLGPSAVRSSDGAQPSAGASGSGGSGTGSSVDGAHQASSKSIAGAVVGGVLGGLASILFLLFAFISLRACQRRKRAGTINEDPDPPAYSDNSYSTISSPSTVHTAQIIPPSKLRRFSNG